MNLYLIIEIDIEILESKKKLPGKKGRGKKMTKGKNGL